MSSEVSLTAALVPERLRRADGRRRADGSFGWLSYSYLSPPAGASGGYFIKGGEMGREKCFVFTKSQFLGI